MAGKRPGRQQQLFKLGAGGRLVHLTDKSSGERFLVDTGATCSVLPFSSSTSTPLGPSLTAADGRRIKTWGFSDRQLCFGDRTFKHTFVLAEVDQPILGVDFLASSQLLVDPAGNRVLYATTLQPVEKDAKYKKTSGLVNTLRQSSVPVRQLLSEFPEVVADSGRLPRTAVQGVEHTIETSGRPVFAKFRRLDATKMAIAEREFRQLEEAGSVRRSKSQWASPLHMVPKKDGSWMWTITNILRISLKYSIAKL